MIDLNRSRYLYSYRNYDFLRLIASGLVIQLLIVENRLKSSSFKTTLTLMFSLNTHDQDCIYCTDVQYLELLLTISNE